MDKRIEQALEFSNFRISLFDKKESIKLKKDSLLCYALNGRIFTANIELITFIKAMIDSGKEKVVVLDINDNPLEITNLQNFYDELYTRYSQAMNYYNAEYENLRKSRNLQNVFLDGISENLK